MSKDKQPRPPAAPVNPYTPKHHLTRHLSESPPSSAQPLPPRSPAIPNQGIPRSERPAEPARQHFDPWNSSSTGHQRAENRLSGSTSWRESRNAKLAAQFAGGAGGGMRLADMVGAGSEGFGKDGRKANGGWERGALGLRGKGQLAIWEAMGPAVTAKKRKAEEDTSGQGRRHGQGMCSKGTDGTSSASDDGHAGRTVDRTGESAGNRHDNPERISADVENGDEVLPASKQIFRGLCFYINGLTAPTISDHKLKRLLAMHGASTSVALGRRTVTHVIIGRTGEGGAVGGLAAGKMQSEIARVGGKGIKYVSVEWVVESVQAGKRLAEAGFSSLKVTPAGQRSVYGMFKREKNVVPEKA